MSQFIGSFKVKVEVLTRKTSGAIARIQSVTAG